MTPPCLLPEIWKYIIYDKLDIPSLANFRITPKAFKNCPELKKLLREKVITWIKQTRFMIFKSSKSIDHEISDNELTNFYYWTSKIKTTYDYSKYIRINRIIREIGLLTSKECPEITNVRLIEGIHKISVDIIPPKGSPYSTGDLVKILIEFPIYYPFESATFTMLSDIFHPNYAIDKNIELYESSVNCAILPIYKMLLEILISLDYPEGIMRSVSNDPILNEDAKTLFLDSPEDFFTYIIIRNQKE